jgi:hypothetical protein
MRTGSRPLRMVAILAAPLALWAALPALQFCHFGWDQLQPECVLAMSIDVAPAPNATESTCDTHPNGDTSEPAGTPCSASTGCPFAPENQRSTAVSLTHCARVDEDARASSPAPHRGRAYCLGGPNGGTGVRPRPPRLIVGPAPPSILIASTAIANPPREIRRIAPQLAVRPPPRIWITRPPVRGPPVV